MMLGVAEFVSVTKQTVGARSGPGNVGRALHAGVKLLAATTTADAGNAKTRLADVRFTSIAADA